MNTDNETIQLLKDKIKLLEKENKKLKKLVFVNELTKLYNRHYFWQLAPSFLNKKPKNTTEKRKNLKNNTLLFIDIDDFKKINDKHGHNKGDQVLQKFAFYLKNKFRKSDLVFRWGGEEFLIILQNISFADALKKTKNLLLDISQQKFSNINLTVSIGLVDISKELDINKVIKKADQLMYQAKKNGKNNICY